MKQLLSWLSGIFNSGAVNSADDTKAAKEVAAEFAQTYGVAHSPFYNHIMSIVKQLILYAQELEDQDDTRAVENALYCVVSKRMSKRDYTGDSSEYLMGLLSDVSEGKYEFAQVCYDNDYASDVFARLNMELVLCLARLE